MRPKILVADDEKLLRLLIQETLDEELFELIQANNGTDALLLAQNERPDLVLLDVEMPGLSGYEVCRQLKSDPTTAHIIVIMLTARSQERDRQQAFQAGTDHFLAKPFSPAHLIGLINQILP